MRFTKCLRARNQGLLHYRRNGSEVYYNIAYLKMVQACDPLREVLFEHLARAGGAVSAGDGLIGGKDERHLGHDHAELDAYLAKLKADLEEVEEEEMFVLGQTGLHVSASVVTKYEKRVYGLKARIEEVEQLVQAKKRE